MSAGDANDMNKVIATMAKDKIEEAIRAAICDDAVIGAFVRAALMQPVQTYDSRGYSGKHVPFIDNAVTMAIHTAAQNAISRAVLEQQGVIEAAVSEALIEGAPSIAAKLFANFADATTGGYGFSLKIEIVKERSDDSY